MKTKSLILATILMTVPSFVNANDSLSVAYKRIGNLERQLRTEVSARERLQKTLYDAQSLINAQKATIDSLKQNVNTNSKNIKMTADQLGVKIADTNTSLKTKADSSDVKSKSLWGVTLLALFVIVGGMVNYLLHKRIKKSNINVEALQQKAEKINEDILNQFSSEMAEMQKISSSLDAISKNTTTLGTGTTGEPDHSLIKTLADRITFMEMTLYKMDPKVKGYKQLSKSISQMKDNLLANGYELVDMLGKPYNEGMKVTPNFVEDEDLEEGQQVITGIIKPQINYKGTMIQAAQITVSQNI